MASNEMKPVIADPLGNRRACRQAQDDTEPDQKAERREAPTVDGPPPTRDRTLVDARKPHPYRSSGQTAGGLLSRAVTLSPVGLTDATMFQTPIYHVTFYTQRLSAHNPE